MTYVMCEYVCECERASVHECVCMRVCLCVRVRTHVSVCVSMDFCIFEFLCEECMSACASVHNACICE